jgi:CDP-diacylglycerol--glycerol-3-phosphate 3-phosphatidyltransferase
MIFTLPNVLSVFRLIAGPIGALMLWAAFMSDTNEEATRWWSYALAFFIAGGITDFLDGWLARRLNQVSAFGALIDPIADKVFVAAFLIAMGIWTGLMIASYAIAAIIARDIVITLVRLSRLNKENVPLPVSVAAKFKTTFEMGAIGWYFALAILPGGNQPWALEVWIWMLWLAAALSLYTGLTYLWALRKTSTG